MVARKWSVGILLLIGVLQCNGCFPYHYTKKPGVSGTVLDADTGKALGGASIRLTTYSFPQNKERTETVIAR